jgi:hypothetical protein
MVEGLLYYCKFLSSLKKKGFTVNPYDPCVWNRDIKGKQMTICFHVDPKVVDYTIYLLHEEYKSVFTESSSKMKVARGKVHQYSGMRICNIKDCEGHHA